MTNVAHFDAGEVFDMAIQTERNGKAFYEAAAAAATDPEVKKIMAYLGDAEGEHETAFRTMKAQFVKAAAAAPEAYDGERDEYIMALLHSRMLKDEAGALQMIRDLQEDLQALDFALGFEKDTILFMFEMREVLPEGERERIDALIQQERTHVRLLQQMKMKREGA
jgi:rubrerythrin